VFLHLCGRIFQDEVISAFWVGSEQQVKSLPGNSKHQKKIMQPALILYRPLTFGFDHSYFGAGSAPKTEDVK